MLLSKLVYKMTFEAEDFGFDLMRYKQIAQHFSTAELKSLWQCFTSYPHLFSHHLRPAPPCANCRNRSVLLLADWRAHYQLNTNENAHPVYPADRPPRI
jgi:hypothetical protein